MSMLDLHIRRDKIVSGTSNVVIRHYVDGIKAGKTLDVSDWSKETIPEGTVIISDGNIFKPLPLTPNEQYAPLPNGYSYVGIVISTIPKSKPVAGIMSRGSVNYKAAPFNFVDIMNELKHIDTDLRVTPKVSPFENVDIDADDDDDDDMSFLFE